MSIITDNFNFDFILKILCKQGNKDIHFCFSYKKIKVKFIFATKNKKIFFFLKNNMLNNTVHRCQFKEEVLNFFLII